MKPTILVLSLLVALCFAATEKPKAVIPVVNDGAPAVKEGAQVVLAVAKANSHARLLIINPDKSVFSIDETTGEDYKTVQIRLQPFTMKPSLWDSKLIMNKVGVVGPAQVEKMIGMLSAEAPFTIYSYRTNTCGVAAIRMIHYLGLDAAGQIKWLANAMHNPDGRGLITDHSHRVYAAMVAGSDAGGFKWRPHHREDKEEEVATKIGDIIAFAADGMTESLKAVTKKGMLFKQRLVNSKLQPSN